MKPLSSIILLSFAVVSCSAPTTVATPVRPAPTPAPATTTTTTTTAPAATAPARSTYVPAVALTEAPRNWQLLDENADRIPGIASERAMKELLAGKTPQRTVLVAIIDNGIDTLHPDLKANLWTNPKEIPGNKVDDDNDGFVDDIHGWDFIGGKDGKDVDFDTFEITREFARCHGKAAASGAPPITDAERCRQIDAEFQKQKTKIESNVQNYR